MKYFLIIVYALLAMAPVNLTYWLGGGGYIKDLGLGVVAGLCCVIVFMAIVGIVDAKAGS